MLTSYSSSSRFLLREINNNHLVPNQYLFSLRYLLKYFKSCSLYRRQMVLNNLPQIQDTETRLKIRVYFFISSLYFPQVIWRISSVSHFHKRFFFHYLGQKEEWGARSIPWLNMKVRRVVNFTPFGGWIRERCMPMDSGCF